MRQLEADKVLAALGGGPQPGKPGYQPPQAAHRSSPFDGSPDSIDWASHAVSAFHHMLGRGHRPTITLLDKWVLAWVEPPGGVEGCIVVSRGGGGGKGCGVLGGRISELLPWPAVRAALRQCPRMCRAPHCRQRARLGMRVVCLPRPLARRARPAQPPCAHPPSP